jgi:hypothetical protein
MPHYVRLLPDAPIVLVEMHKPYDYQHEPKQLFNEIHALIDPLDWPRAAVIYDCTRFELSFNDVVDKMAVQTRGFAGSMSDDRLETIIVGQGEMFHFMVESFKQDQYRNLHVHLFEDFEQALGWAYQWTLEVQAV